MPACSRCDVEQVFVHLLGVDIEMSFDEMGAALGVSRQMAQRWYFQSLKMWILGCFDAGIFTEDEKLTMLANLPADAFTSKVRLRDCAA